MQTEDITSIIESRDEMKIESLVRNFLKDESRIELRDLVDRNYDIACRFAKKLSKYYIKYETGEEYGMTNLIFSLAISDQVDQMHFTNLLNILSLMRNKALSKTLVSVLSEGALQHVRETNLFLTCSQIEAVDDSNLLFFFEKHLKDPKIEILEDISREGLNTLQCLLKKKCILPKILNLLLCSGRETHKSGFQYTLTPILFYKSLQGKTFKQEFDTLYNENKDKLFLQKTYPINEDNVRKWIDLQSTEDARMSAILFREYTQHISFSQFKETLYKVCYDAIRKITSERFEKVILLCGPNMIKSDLWVALLSWAILKDYVTDVVPVSKTLKYRLMSDMDKKTLVLHCDDCAYSGNQLTDAIQDIKTKSSQSKRSNVSSFAIVPYVSRKSEQRLKVKIEDDTDQFKYYISDQSERFDSLLNNLRERRDLIKYFQRGQDLHTIYFDHKLADYVSIYDKLYSNAQDLQSGQLFDFSLISNCSAFECYTSSESERPQQDRCPPAFYKFIDYTYKGISIKKEMDKNHKLNFLSFVKIE